MSRRPGPLARGRAVAPAFTRGVGLTILLSLVAAAGRVVVPVSVQQTVDRGISAAGGPRPGLVAALAAMGAGGVLLTAAASAWANRRVFGATEAGLAQLRVAAFRHVHDLSVAAQNEHRRGSLVARVTTDVDTISTFVQWGGLLLVTSCAQLLVATALMLAYSPLLTAVVWGCFTPLLVVSVLLQPRVSAAYALVRERVGDVLSSVSEAVVGAATLRVFGVADRTRDRAEHAVQAHRRAAVRAQTLVATSFTLASLVSGLAVAAVLVVGAATGVDGDLTLGRLLAFGFLVQLFTGPVQMSTEVLNELQNAGAGWRRVVQVLDTPVGIADPAEEGRDAAGPPPGALSVRLDGVGFAYPGGPPVLHDVDLDLPAGVRVAVVGRTGSGKSTLARLITRLADPQAGRVLLGGVDVRDIPFEQLRRRVTLVPQEGFLLDTTLEDNIAWARPGTTPAQVREAVAVLGLQDWVDQLPHGWQTAVGPRGESLSAGERQLVALARAQVCAPDVLVLDEATSSVDPATETRVHTALEALGRGRTTVTIAHRLSTAVAADLVVVVEDGRVADVGTHAEVLDRCAAYQELFAGWTAARAEPV
ncbi:MAG: ABC transporter ATP-binding protein [Kineosporiaceae bacterium]